MPRTRSALAPAALLTLLLSACGTAATSSGEGGGSDENTSAVTVEHAMGSTDVECTPQRVVTLGQGQTDSVLALGVTPVGVVSPWTDDWYSYLPDEVNEAEVLGTELEPDLEAIAALEPDVILGSKLRHEALYDQLSQIAPTVFSETIGVTWKENVSLWSEALCLEEEGEQIVTEYEERAAALGSALAERDEADTEVSMIRFMPDQVRIYLTGFPGSVLRDAGLQRPEAQQVEDWASSDQLIEISEERIPEMDGDVIFQMVSSEHYAQQGSQTVDEQIERWTSTDLWQNLSAVQAGNVVVVDESHWNLGGGIGSANAMLDDLEDHFLDGE
ncbi:ABC transporter substrate-binding protein [Ruania alba]|nr:iron-siderophore ABC transporter substrate-binding protein [Ruania alba]